jgi:hypothetical protein
MEEDAKLREIMEMLTPEEIQSIKAAYKAFTRIGRETARGNIWYDFIDEAHQKLGVTLALVSVHRPDIDMDDM